MNSAPLTHLAIAGPIGAPTALRLLRGLLWPLLLLGWLQLERARRKALTPAAAVRLATA